MLKRKIVELCYRVAMTHGYKCDAYFPNGRPHIKVIIVINDIEYEFVSYRKAIEFLQS